MPEKLTLTVTLSDLFGAYERFVSAVEAGTYQYDIVLAENLPELTEQDLGRYRAFLNLLAERVVTERRENNRYIAIDVLTDIFSHNADSAAVQESYLYCRHCPCFQCAPNPEEFTRESMNQYMPYWQYCKKAFAELAMSKYIADELKLPIAISDIDFHDLDYLVRALYGNHLERYKMTEAGQHEPV